MIAAAGLQDSVVMLLSQFVSWLAIAIPLTILQVTRLALMATGLHGIFAHGLSAALGIRLLSRISGTPITPTTNPAIP